MDLLDAKTIAKHAFDTGRLAHAYLITGDVRGDALALAKYMSKLVLCENGACDNCEVCKAVDARTYVDIFWLYPLKKSRVISVDQIRRGHGENKIAPPYLLPWLSEASFLGGWKVAVISDADTFNVNAANAFLKMLEEPPQRSLILLLTEKPEQLLPTIRSRCQRIDIRKEDALLPPQYRKRLLDALSAPPVLSGISPISALALGGVFIDILNSLKNDAKEEVRKFLEDSVGLEISDEELEARETARYREFRTLFFATLESWYRDIMILRAGGEESTIRNKDYLDAISRIATSIDLSWVLTRLSAIPEMLTQLNRSISETSIIPYWVDRLI